MSAPTGREREPDKAALDELERAFADGDETDSGNPPLEGRPSAPPETDDAGGGGPTQPVAPSKSTSDDGPSGTVEPIEPDEFDDIDDRDVSGDADDELGDLGIPHDVEPDEFGESGDSDDITDLDEFEPGGLDEQSDPEELLIVEAEPVGDPSPATPKVIRIDDYGGSEVLDELPREPVHAGGAVDDAGGAIPEGEYDSADPIVIEIDDEMPDAVYVEGSLDRSGSRSIVFIEDDDTGDTLAPEAERDIRRGIEPRMRERRVAVKRAKGRKRLKWVALVGTIVVLVVGALAVLGSGWFAIQEDQVFVTGNVYTDPERLQEVIDDLVGTPVLLADTQGAEADLEAIPWVDTARVRTDFPHTVTIEIRERQAISTYQGPDQSFRVLDRDGRVLDVIENYPIAYVLITGPDPVDLDAGEFAPRGYAAASELAKNLTGSVRGRVERIEVTSDGSRLVMYLDDGIEVRFGEARDLIVKLIRLETVLSSGDIGDSGVIDVSTNEVTL